MTMTKNEMKILHIITGLGDGGAEHTLYKICKYDFTNKHIVISLTDKGKYFSLLKKIKVKVYCLNTNFFSINKFFLLIKLIRFIKPNIVQTWLVHADFIGGIASRIAGIDNVIWNVRYSKIHRGKAKLTTILIIKLLSKISYFLPKLIVIVSRRAKKIYEMEGYDKKKFRYIPNGYDLSILKVLKKKQIKFKKAKKKLPLIGYVARYDPLKDHSNLLNAIALIKMKGIVFSCLLVGTNINKNKNLINEIKRLKLTKYIKLYGPTKDISTIMNLLDIHVQSSRSEGFPNVVAEAMSFKTPCIVTDVGDSSYIVGKTGWVISPNNPIKLAKAIELGIDEIGTKNWNNRCEKARERIKEKFNLGKMVKSYNKVWTNVLKKNNKKLKALN